MTLQVIGQNEHRFFKLSINKLANFFNLKLFHGEELEKRRFLKLYIIQIYR